MCCERGFAYRGRSWWWRWQSSVGTGSSQSSPCRTPVQRPCYLPAIYLVFTWSFGPYLVPLHPARVAAASGSTQSSPCRIPVPRTCHLPAIYLLFTWYLPDYLAYLVRLHPAREHQFNDPAARHRRTVRVVLVQVLVAMVTLRCRPRNRVVPRDSHVQTSSRLNDK